jgi:hypothetical protein
MAIQRQSRSSAEIRVRASGNTAAGPRICTCGPFMRLNSGTIARPDRESGDWARAQTALRQFSIRILIFLVEPRGIEPLTSTMPLTRYCW